VPGVVYVYEGFCAVLSGILIAIPKGRVAPVLSVVTVPSIEIFFTAELAAEEPKSATYTLPVSSTATPDTVVNPVARVEIVPPEEIFLIILLV
jgi:hypothetical protein